MFFMLSSLSCSRSAGKGRASEASQYGPVAEGAGSHLETAGCFAPFTRRAHQVVDQETTSAPSAPGDDDLKAAAGSDWANLPAGVLAKTFNLVLKQNSRWPSRQVTARVALADSLQKRSRRAFLVFSVSVKLRPPNWVSAQTLFAASGTCANWRSCSQEAFYGSKSSLKTINRPAELFHTVGGHVSCS